MLHHGSKHHFQLYYYLRHKELGALYASYFIKLFGESFISVFTAIFLLVNGFSISQVAIYYIIYFAVAFTWGFVARASMKHIGVVKTLGTGIVGFILYYYFLRGIADGVPYQFVAAIYGVAAGMYFSAFNVELAHALRRDKNEGSAVAMIRIIALLTGIVGPLAGAIFVTQLSFELLFMLVSVVLVFSVLPLFWVGDYKVSLPHFSLRRIFAYGSFRRGGVYALNGAVMVGLEILWPAFIYLNFKNFIAVGGIVSATSLAMSVIIYVIGRFSDHHQAQSYKYGVLSHAPTWLLRLVLLTPGGLLVSNLLSSVTAYLIDIPLNKAVYHAANQSKHAVDYFIFVGICTTIGRIGLLVVAVAVSNMTVVFGIIAVLTMLHLLLLPELKQTHALPKAA